MTESKPGRGSDQFALRFPDGLREKIKISAKKNNRSMNSEIVFQLEEMYTIDISELKDIIGDLPVYLGQFGNATVDMVIRNLQEAAGFEIETTRMDVAVEHFNQIERIFRATTNPEAIKHLRERRKEALGVLAKYIDD